MKISVVMSVYNGAQHLAETIDSILAQTERDFELVIVDDGSTDATPRILRESTDPRIRVITQPNAGLSRALITGCEAACAPLIARQDVGDLSHPERLAKQAALFERWPELVLAACNVDFVGPQLEYLYSPRDTAASYAPVRLTPPVTDGPNHHGAAMFRRDAYVRAGGYRAEFYYAQDWDLWFRLAELGTFARVPETLYTARIFADSLSSEARVQQTRLAEISREATAARQRGESEAPMLAAAVAIGRVPRSKSRRRRAEGLYFIGAALVRNRDPRARRYLARAAAAWPLSIRAWARLLQSLILWPSMNFLRAIHRKLGIKYRVDRCRKYARRFGVRGAWSTYRRLWSRTGALQEIEVPGIPHRVAIRAGTADASTLEKMFVWNDYDLDYPPNVKTVIDAGANIGLSAVFFANRFPDATIIAIEPEEQNFALLRRNTASYEQIVPLHAALWSEDTTLRLSNPDDRVDSYRFDPVAVGSAVPAFSVPSILNRYGMAAADVLKIDIEGGETVVFQSSDSWIDRVRMFVVELHGDDAIAAFTAATSRLRARRYRQGENEIVVVDEPER